MPTEIILLLVSAGFLFSGGRRLRSAWRKIGPDPSSRDNELAAHESTRAMANLVAGVAILVVTLGTDLTAGPGPNQQELTEQR
jgi:hypothetical protein